MAVEKFKDKCSDFMYEWKNIQSALGEKVKHDIDTYVHIGKCQNFTGKMELEDNEIFETLYRCLHTHTHMYI